MYGVFRTRLIFCSCIYSGFSKLGVEESEQMEEEEER